MEGSSDQDPCWCEVCSCRVSSAGEMKLHLNGKKHALQVVSRQQRERHQRQSVFVRNFPTGTSESELITTFSHFGKVQKVLLEKSDKPKYAIIELNSEDTVQAVLRRTEPILIGGKHLVVKPRSTSEKSHPPHHNASPGKRAASASLSPRRSSKDRGGRQEVAMATDSVEKEADEELSSLLTALNNAKTLDEQFSVLVSEQCLADENVSQRQALADRVSAALVEHAYPSTSQISVVPYGSSANGFGLKKSDVDLCLLTGSVLPQQSKADETILTDCFSRSKLVSPSSSLNSSMASVGEVSMEEPMDIAAASADRHVAVENELKTVVAVLRQHVPGCSRVHSISRARRPLVRFYHTELHLPCDLTLNNRLAVENTRLLRCYATQDRRVRPLVYAVRAWARHHSLGGSSVNLLSGYALALMVIAFLQRCDPPVLPCLQKNIGYSKVESHSAENCIEGWDCSFEEQSRFSSVNFQSCGELLHGFFSYYSLFDFEANAVTISTPQTVTIAEVTALATALRQEVDPSEADAPRHRPFRQSSICVVDPFELTHNVSGGVGPMLSRKFLDQCRSAALLCETRCLEEHTAALAVAASSESDNVWGLALLIRPPVQGQQRLLSFRLPTSRFSVPAGVAGVSGCHDVEALKRLCKLLEEEYAFQTHLAVVKVDETSPSTDEDPDDVHGLSDEQKVGMKRRAGDEAQPPAKRHRVSESDADVSTISGRDHAQCVALENSWLHRRRWRRVHQRQQSNAAEAHDGEKVPVLQFSLFAVCSDDSCCVVFEPHASTDMKVLHSFVCVFKKDILQRDLI